MIFYSDSFFRIALTILEIIKQIQNMAKSVLVLSYNKYI